jgi:hypothetical protein
LMKVDLPDSPVPTQQQTKKKRHFYSLKIKLTGYAYMYIRENKLQYIFFTLVEK